MTFLLVVLALAPDLSGMLRLTSQGNFAHGCPIAMDKALTSRHVVEGYGNWLWGVSDGEDAHGVLKVERLDDFRDIALVAPDSEARFPKWYSLSEKAPKAGEKVYFLGFDFKSMGEAFSPREFKATVVRIFNGNVVYEPAGKPGSSGSCVLNEAGEVVAINQGGKEIENDKGLAGIGVGVWGNWLSLKRDEPQAEEKEVVVEAVQE